MFRHPLPLATSNLRGVHSRKQPRAGGNKAAKPKTGKVNSPDRKAERLVPIQTSSPPKNELGQRHREPPNPPRNLPTLQTPNQPISPAPTEGQRRAANSDMRAGGLLGRKKGLRAPAGRRGRAKPRGGSDGSGGPKGRAGRRHRANFSRSPPVKGPFRPSTALFGPPIRLQARCAAPPPAFLCPALHSRSSLPRPRPPQEGVGLSPRVFRLRGGEMMILYFAFSVLPLSLGLE